MKDVAALCKRVVIIADGQIQYDGSLSGIIDETTNRKLVTLQFADPIDKRLLGSLKRFGHIVHHEAPRVKLEVTRDDVPAMLTAILDAYDIDDLIVEEPPLEEVIADVFTRVSETSATQSELGLSRSNDTQVGEAE